nr:phage regulatory CII family protein [uncultured Roseateles sp.]
MNVLDAAYWTGQKYPGGAEGLALRMGRPNLSDELNPNRKSAKLGLHDSVVMQVMARDYRILHAMAAELGHMAVPLPDLAEGEAPGAAQVALVAQDFGKLMQEVAEDAADNQISDNELARLERRAGELIAHVQLMLKNFANLNAAAKVRQAGES